MRAYVRRAAVGAACLVVGLWLGVACVPAVAGANETPSSGGSQGGGLQGSGLRGGSLTIPGGEGLFGGELQADARQARRMNPEMVSARGRSRTEFEHLGRAAAEKVAGEAFPQLVNTPAGGPPKLPEGTTATGFPTDNAESVDLPGGKHGVVESLGPIARETSHGHRVALDLMPHESGGGFAPDSGLVGLHIPKRIGGGGSGAGGASLTESGVSLTPVDAHGAPLEGAEGVVDGASVFYGDTENAGDGVRDVDTLVKPETGGFEEETLLRSAASPSTLYYKVGLPAGASLVKDMHSPNTVRVVDAGQTIAMISAPSAQDAEGTSVPLGLAVDGNTVVLMVQRGAGEYEYPIEVDPRAYDYTIQLPSQCKNNEGKLTNWEFHYSGGGFECYSSGVSSGYGVVMATVGGVNEGEHDELRYPAHGQSSVTFVEGEMAAAASTRSEAVTKIEFVHEKTVEREFTLAKAGEDFSRKLEHECDQPVIEEGVEHCKALNNENQLRITQADNAKENVPEGYGFWFELYNGTWVSVFQEQGPEVSFNTSSALLTFEKEHEGVKENVSRENVLFPYGIGWLSKTSGAFEVVAEDHGLGVSHLTIKDITPGATLSLSKSPLSEGHCTGVWCSQKLPWYVPYEGGMVEGENTIEVCAEDASYTKTCADKTVKVDNTTPYGIKLKGMAEKGAELSATPHQITVEATDGTKSTPSSGIESLAVSVDGREIGTPQGACRPGECTASATFTLDGETLGAGEHELVVAATDYAGNEERKGFTFAVRNATPVTLGPGSVDPVTGQYRVSAGDVDQAGVGSVSRVYTSRAWTAGLEGPLGPQWGLSAGAGESIKILGNGNAELRSANGGRTTFKAEAGKFVSPKGDENITLEPHEEKAGKGITGYLLKDAAAGTTTTFTLPSGGGLWVPAATEGTAPDDKTMYAYRTAPQYNEYALPSGSGPWGIAQGSEGDLWYADGSTNKIGKITTSGGISEYSLSPGSEPHEIVQGPEGSMWFTEWGTSKIGQLKPTGEIKEYTLPLGSEPHDIAAGPSETVWFTEYNTHRIGRYVASAGVTEYELPASSEPHDITPGPGGTLWFTDLGTGKIGFISVLGAVSEFSSGGVDPHSITEGGPKDELWYTVGGSAPAIKVMSGGGKIEHEYALPEGSEPYGIVQGPEGDLWFTDEGTSKIGKISPSSGQITEYALPSGSDPVDLALGPDGNFWYTDKGTNRIGVITPAGTIAEPVEILGPEPANVSCGKNPAEVSQAELSARLAELKVGCRALSFTYAESTTATGEEESQWGEYKGRLAKVSLTAYNPAASSKKMETVAVAQYSYDKQGRLRAEWDPRVETSTGCGKICSALKTTYGYDAEGHVTALTPPGQEPWAFTYGTISGDTGTGRLLKVNRAPASAGLWKGEAVKNTEVPKITGSATVGIRLAVSNGTWSGSPASQITYGYQWDDCNTSGENCSSIAGATNPNYTPVSSDIGHKLVAQVIATNGDGSVSAVSAASAAVPDMSVTAAVDSGNSLEAIYCQPNSGQATCITGDNKGKMYTSFAVTATSGGVWDSLENPGASPIEAIDCTPSEVCLTGAGGNLYYFPSELTWREAYGSTYGADGISCPSSSLCVDGQNGDGYFRYSTNPGSTSWTSEQQGTAAMKGVDCLSTSFCILADSTGHVHVAISTSQIESSSWKESDVDGSTALNGVACTSTTSCVAVDGAGNVIDLAISASNGEATASKHDIDGTNSLTAITCTESSTCVTVDNQGYVFASKNGGATWSKVYSFGDKLTSLSCISVSLCVAADTTGNIDAFNPSIEVTSEGEVRSPQPGATVEYHVPLSGSGAPYQMASAETAKWGEKGEHLPFEATAIFPPDEPQGWPASGYKRASIDYLDGEARTVNTASPSGGISTTEYNQYNEVTRTLSAADRAIAMKESCESETKCKSAEVAEHLSSMNIYNGETQAEKEQEEKEGKHEAGVRLLETYGPEHEIKLANGTEEETRDHHTFSYNEGAPSGEEHNLVTKEKGWVETPGHLKIDEEIKLKIYSGQNNLGWKLRKATMETSEKEGRRTMSTTTYEPETGAVTQAGSTTASTSLSAPLVSLTSFGKGGSGNGQFNHPGTTAVGAGGNVWVTDQYNDRIQEFSSSGGFIAAYGSKGTGAGQFERPWGIAANSGTGNVYVGDLNDNRVEELSSSGTFVRTFGFGVTNGENKFEICTSSCRAGIAGSGAGQLNRPGDIAIDPSGNVWVADYENGRVEEYRENGEYVGSVGSKGAKGGQLSLPMGLAVSDGHLYVTEVGNSRVDEWTLAGKFVRAFGFGVANGEDKFETCETETGCGAGISGSGKGQFNAPFDIAADPVSGALFVADWENHRVEEFTIDGEYVTEFGSYGSGEGQIESDSGVAVAPSGEVYVADEGNERIDVWEPKSSAPLYASQFGKGDFSHPLGDAVDAHGDLWVASKSGANLQEFSASGSRLATYGKSGAGAGEMGEPVGVAINQSTGNVYVGEAGNNRVQEFNEKGEFVRVFGWGVSNGESKLEVCTSGCKAGLSGAGAGELKEAGWVAVDSAGNVWVSDWGNNRVQEFNEKGEFVRVFGWGVSNGESKLEVCTSGCKAGLSGSGAGELSGPTGIAVWNGRVYVADAGNNRIEVFSSEGAYVSTIGAKGAGNGQFSHPLGLAVTPAGNLFVADAANNRVQELVAESGTYLTQFGTSGTGNGQFKEPGGVAVNAAGDVEVVDVENGRVEEFQPQERPGNEGAEESVMTYYTAAANAEHPSCGKHPEWANLICQTEPVAQPGDAGPPALPVTTTTYNMWDEPETIVEKIGSVTRTTEKIYDGAGRQISSKETSSSSPENPAVPAVTNEYSTETGALVKQSQTVEGKAETITSVYNTLGQLTSYTDAAGATTTYTYDIDGRVEEMNEPKGKQIYSYDATTGFLTKLLDSAAGTFIATYNVAGQLLTENYPNGMVARYTYNPIGQATNLEYEKTTHCSEKCVLFTDADAYGARGEMMTQTSSLAKEEYKYNEMGQLTETQETPAGEGCKARAYGYDEEGERTSLTTREPCTSEGGLVEAHDYDVAGRLIDPGVAYDGLGNMTKVPAADAGGMAITSSFYADNQVATQEQNGKTIDYSYDPTGRTLLAVTKQTSGTTDATPHYAGPGEALTWTCEESGGCKEEKESKWTRDIPGIGGTLDAIQTNGGTPMIELHDLSGNIVATVADNEEKTELHFLPLSTEFGVAPENKAPKYGWLGASGAKSELETGVITEAGATYVPQLAITLQTEQVIPPGSVNECVGCDETYHPSELPWANESGNEAAANTLAEQRAKEHGAEMQRDRSEVIDPGEVWYFTKGQAELLGLAIDSAGAYLTYSDLGGWLKHLLHIDFISELEEWGLEELFGFNRSDVVQWGTALANGLSNCTLDMETGWEHPKDPHCWVYVYISEFAPLGVTLDKIPNFKRDAQVQYCPRGKKRCKWP